MPPSTTCAPRARICAARPRLGRHPRGARRRHERLRIARESVATSQGFVREIDAEIAARKAMLSGSAAEARLAASNAGLAMLARDRRDLTVRLGHVVGLVQEAGRLASVSATLRKVAPDAVRIVEACARSGLRREAPPDEILRVGGPLAGLLDALAQMPDVTLSLESAAEDLGYKARERENEVRSLSGQVQSGRTSAARLSADTEAFREELSRLGIEAVPVCELAEIVDPKWGPALEGLLGRAREALVVEPDRLDRAFALLDAKKNQFFRCLLVKTTDTSRARGAADRRRADGPDRDRQPARRSFFGRPPRRLRPRARRRRARPDGPGGGAERALDLGHGLFGGAAGFR